MAPDVELELLREYVARAERERDEYAKQVHELTTRVAQMTSAATMAAGTAEAALRRLQRFEALASDVDAAVRRFRSGEPS